MADGKVTIDTSLDESGAIKGIKSLGGKLGGLAGSAFKGTAVAIGGVGAAIVGLGASAVKYNAEMEQYQTSFEVMTGSAEKATDVVNRLKQIGAATPFEFEDLAKATQTLMAFGFSADDAIDQFKVLGDISQGDSQKLDTFTQALGKMQSSGKVQLDTLNMMIDQGFNPLNIIAQKTGKSMSQLYDDVSKGKISVDQVKDAMITATSAGGQFYQSMDKQSQTLMGKISTLKDNFQQLTGAIFSGASSDSGSIIDLAIDWVNQLQTAFTQGGTNAMITAMGTIMAQMVTQGAAQAPQIINLAVSVIESFIAGIVNNSQQINTGAVQIITALVTGITDLMPQLLMMGFILMQDLTSGIIANIPALVPAIVQMMVFLINTIIQWAPMIWDAFKQIIGGIGNELSNAGGAMAPFGAILQFISNNLGALVTVIGSIVAAIIIYRGVTTAMTAAQWLLNAALNANPIGAVILIITSLIGAIIYLWNTNEAFRAIVIAGWNALKAAAEVVFNALVNFFTVKVPGALAIVAVKLAEFVQWWKDLPGNILKFIEGIPGKLLNVGKNIVDGLWNGIKNGWNGLISGVKGLVNLLPDAVKNVLGIHSPSRVFKWIGEMSAKGLGIGFEENNPVDSWTNSIVPAVGNLSNGVSGISNTNTSNYGLAGIGGMVADAIANSNLTVKIGNKEMGRVVRGYA